MLDVRRDDGDGWMRAVATSIAVVAAAMILAFLLTSGFGDLLRKPTEMSSSQLVAERMKSNPCIVAAALAQPGQLDVCVKDVRSNLENLKERQRRGAEVDGDLWKEGEAYVGRALVESGTGWSLPPAGNLDGSIEDAAKVAANAHTEQQIRNAALTLVRINGQLEVLKHATDAIYKYVEVTEAVQTLSAVNDDGLSPHGSLREMWLISSAYAQDGTPSKEEVAEKLMAENTKQSPVAVADRHGSYRFLVLVTLFCLFSGLLVVAFTVALVVRDRRRREFAMQTATTMIGVLGGMMTNFVTGAT